MTWVMRLPQAGTVESDDFTLDDLDAIEQATGVPWSRMNPWQSAKVAREFIRTGYRLTGMEPDEADEATARVGLRQVKSLFDHRPDAPFTDDEPDGDGSDAAPLAPSSPPSSTGAPTGGDGHRRKPAKSG